MGFRVPWFQRFIVPRALPLVRGGKLLHDNMRRELITGAELMAQLREQGVANLEDVELACIEGTGQISVVTRDATGGEPHGPDDCAGTSDEPRMADRSEQNSVKETSRTR